jgi:hypothetical protein
VNVNYRKVRDVADRAAGRTPAARPLLSLGEANRRYVRAHDALDAAQANNRDRMRKPVAVPWAEFFSAVRALSAAARAVTDAHDVT